MCVGKPVGEVNGRESKIFGFVERRWMPLDRERESHSMKAYSGFG